MYTDMTGNLPELSNMTKYVSKLSTQLDTNRDAITKITEVATRVVGQEREKITKLRESYTRHGSGIEADNRSPDQQAGDADDTDTDDNASSVDAAEDDTHTSIAKENLDLRIELQRLEQAETAMAALVRRFQVAASTAMNGADNYMQEYAVAAQALVDSYKSRLELEKQTQQKLKETRRAMVEELANLGGMVSQTNVLVGNELRHRQGPSHEQDTFLKYTKVNESI